MLSIALTIAGSDPSGGAGLQADLKTFTALGVYGASIVTALTAQNTLGVTAAMAVPPDFIAAQMDAVLSDLAVGAAKTGMLGDAPTVRAVVEGIRKHTIRPLVVDPVMVATSGDVLLAEDAIETVRSELIPLATLITPNLPEAAKLLGEAIAADEAAMADQARSLLALGCGAVLLKGGHGTGPEAVDLLVTARSEARLAKPRIETRNTHGTGCTLAAAIAAHLALGFDLVEAVARSKDFLWLGIKSGSGMSIGSGAGPVDHLFAIRKGRI